MRDFRKLAVWQKAHQLAVDTYHWTLTFPRAEMYGLTSQMRRAAISIPSNIAEGCGREGDAELARFIRISMGSASELEYQVFLSHALGYLSPDGEAMLTRNVQEVKRMQTGLLARLKPRNPDITDC
jgi:four helix bundle protein